MLKSFKVIRDTLITILLTGGGVYQYFNGNKATGIICIAVGCWLVSAAFWDSRKQKQKLR